MAYIAETRRYTRKAISFRLLFINQVVEDPQINI